MILAIARGGLLVGAALGYALSVKNVYTMNVEYYTGVDERLEVPRILPPAPDFVDLDDARILIADDVADTGHTLESVQDFCEGKVGGGSRRRPVREAAHRRSVRLRLAAHRSMDRLPVERAGARCHPGARRAGRLTPTGARAGGRRRPGRPALDPQAHPGGDDRPGRQLPVGRLADQDAAGRRELLES